MKWRLAGCLFAGALGTAYDPFMGNPSKSKLTKERKVENAGGNKYAFDFGGGVPETIVADGTDQRSYVGREGKLFKFEVPGFCRGRWW